MRTHEQFNSVPYLVWDTGVIAEQQAQHLIDIGEATNEDESFAMTCEDSDLLSFEWTALTESLTKTLKTLNPDGYWCAEVTNFGWRRQKGYAEFKADNGSQFLDNILPETDCTFNLFQDEDGTIRIQNFHHDAPIGNEWYTIQPICKKHI